MAAALCVALLLVLAIGVGLGRDVLRPHPAPATVSAWNAATDVWMAAEVAALPWAAGSSSGSTAWPPASAAG